MFRVNFVLEQNPSRYPSRYDTFVGSKSDFFLTGSGILSNVEKLHTLVCSKA